MAFNSADETGQSSSGRIYDEINEWTKRRYRPLEDAAMISLPIFDADSNPGNPENHSAFDVGFATFIMQSGGDLGFEIHPTFRAEPSLLDKGFAFNDWNGLPELLDEERKNEIKAANLLIPSTAELVAAIIKIFVSDLSLCIITTVNIDKLASILNDKHRMYVTREKLRRVFLPVQNHYVLGDMEKPGYLYPQEGNSSASIEIEQNGWYSRIQVQVNLGYKDESQSGPLGLSINWTWKPANSDLNDTIRSSNQYRGATDVSHPSSIPLLRRLFPGQTEVSFLERQARLEQELRL